MKAIMGWIIAFVISLVIPWPACVVPIVIVCAALCGDDEPEQKIKK